MRYAEIVSRSIREMSGCKEQIMLSSYENRAAHEGHCFAIFACSHINDCYDGFVVAAAEYIDFPCHALSAPDCHCKDNR